MIPVFKPFLFEVSDLGFTSSSHFFVIMRVRLLDRFRALLRMLP
jgi:hypothetical protein